MMHNQLKCDIIPVKLYAGRKAEMSLVIVHLTDVHIHDEKDLVLQKTDQIAHVIISHLHKSDDLLIAVTGDIAFSGKKEQYDLASEFFDNIMKTISDNFDVNPIIIFVAGNHDCDLIPESAVRNALFEDIQTKRYEIVPEEIKNIMMNAQHNYSDFIYRYYNDTCPSSLCSSRLLSLRWGKIFVILYNTAWMSQLHEKEGSLFFPQNEYPILPDTDIGLIISMAHHPLNWFDSVTSNSMKDFIRKNTDIMLWGHEHRKDSANIYGNKWNFMFKNGKELQSGPLEDDSAFAVYSIDDTRQSIHTSTYLWNHEKKIYCEDESYTDAFSRNTSTLQREFTPNDNTIKRMNDYGTIIRHFSQEQITLHSLFCWPEIVAIDDQKEHKGYISYTSQEQIVSLCLNKRIVLISGSTLSGKTALAKMLFQNIVNEGKICIIAQGNDLIVQKGQLEKRIDKIFEEEYHEGLLDQFHQKDKREKVLIIDDFETIGQNTHDISDFSRLSDQFEHIILFSGSEEHISSMVANHAFPDEKQIFIYRIRHFGNLKRDELVRRWFTLNNQLIPESELEIKIENALGIINSLMGGFRSFVPSTPITIVGILQSINATNGNSHLRSSQFGYLYDDLVHSSLRPIVNEEDDTLNIYIAMLSEVAYKMFSSHSYSLTSIELVETIVNYTKRKILTINVVTAIEGLVEASILQSQADQDYCFRYPYLFYYFVAQYIAKHIDEDTVKKQISDMSENLHIEAYGNIMVFVCHFSHNNTIIENILLKAYCTLDCKKPLDLKNPGEYLSDSYKNIEKTLAIRRVGTENDVPMLRQEDLKEKDMQEESVVRSEAEDNWQNDGMGEEVADIISAMKTIDVLGQILKNYPGDIDGDVKNNIILTIDELSMRVLQAAIDLFNSADEQYIMDCSKRLSKEDPSLSTVTLMQKVKSFFSFITFSFSNSLIARVAYAIQSKHLITAASSLVSAGQGSLSLEISLWKIKLLCQESPDYGSLIKFNKELKKQKYDIAAFNLRTIVIGHLRHRHIGYKERDRLCTEFNLEKALSMPNNQ